MINKHKYFKIKKIINRREDVTYKIIGYDNIFDLIFGVGDFYEKENASLQDAIIQIQIIAPLIKNLLKRCIRHL